MKKTAKKKTSKRVPFKKVLKKILANKRFGQFFFLVTALTIFSLGLQAHRSWQMQREQEQFEQANKTEFIEIVGKTAKPLAAKNDLYASVMVAQAILESHWGQSKLTKEANNLFGVKGDYLGQTYQIQTQEDDGSGRLYTIMADFRKYPTYHVSLEDNAALLKNGVSWDPEYYAGTWKSRTKTYKDATSHLQGRYATDTSYAKKLNELIVQYDLTRFDE